MAFVALHPRGVHRVVAAGTLWATASEARAGASLRSALWRLRSASPVPLVDVGAERLRLLPYVSVDVHEQTAAARRALDPATPPQDYRQELDGELLPGWYEEWVLVERDRLRQLRLHALESASERLATASRFAEAIEVALAAVAADPLRETAHQALIRSHLAEGNVAEALLQYRRYASLLRRKVGAAPSRRLRELVEPLLGGEQDWPTRT